MKSVYGNNDYIEYSYDNLDRIIGKKYNGTEKFKYDYTSSGMIGYHKDLVNNESYHYEYDLSDRLSQIVNSKGETTKFYYDQGNNVSKVEEFIEGRTYSTNYEYDQDNRPTLTEFADTNHQYNYDLLGRVTSERIWSTDTSLDYIMNYVYEPFYSQYGSTTNLIAVTSDGIDYFFYEYDGNGNIITIYSNIVM